MALLFAVLAGPLFAANPPVWCTGTGTARLAWFDGVTSAVDLQVLDGATTNRLTDLALTDGSTIKFVAPWGSPDSFLGGSLRFGGAMSVRLGETTARIEPLDLFALKDTDVFEWRDEDSNPVLTVDHLDVRFDPGMRTLLLARGNVRIAADFAERAGRTALAGLVVGAFEAAADVRELAARIQRRPRALPAACDTPAGTNAQLRLVALDVPQVMATNLFRIAVPFQIANDGPAALPYDLLGSLAATIEVARADASGGVVRTATAMPVHIDPPEACPCPDLSLFPPGMTSLVSIADAELAGGLELSLPPGTQEFELAVRLGDSTVAGRFRLHRDGPFPRVEPLP